MIVSAIRVRAGLSSAMAVGVLTLALGASAATAHATSGPMVAVAQGVNPSALPGATGFGDTPADTPETVSFIMREHNLDQLKTAVQQGIRQDLTVDQFAAVYGQTPQAISALTRYLSGFGISTQVYRDDVDVVANGTAGEFDQALAVQQREYHVPAVHGLHGMRGIPGQTVHGAAGSPELPGPLARTVLAILGLSNYSSYTSNTVHAGAASSSSASSAGCPGVLPPAAPVGLELSSDPSGCHTAADFARQYNLTPLYRQGAAGQGQTLAIVTLAALDPGAPQYYWRRILHQTPSGRTVNVDNVDGGPGAPSDASGTGETDLDVEQSGGIAPGANVIVYQAPNTDPGFADAFFTAASQDTAGSLSTSWGEPETYLEEAVAAGEETSAYTAAFDEAFLELAAQGQSAFDAAGDDGSYDAQEDPTPNTNLSVDTPADSPYITASGGTTLPLTATVAGTVNGDAAGTENISVSQQRAWGWDYAWQAAANTTPESLASAAEANVVGGGGGFSSFYSEPWYQSGVPGTDTFSAVPYLTPTDYVTEDGLTLPEAWSFDPTPSVVQGFASGRAVPDLAANADPISGYLLYEPSWAPIGQPTLQEGWGGTSFVAPQFNGSTAVIDSYVGRRVGFWNPSIYAFARGGSSPFTPLDQGGTDNDNIYYTGTPGTLFNEASGLGYPDLTKLAQDFATR